MGEVNLEIESAVVANPSVAQAEVTGSPHDIKSESFAVYLILKGSHPTGDKTKKLRD